MKKQGKCGCEDCAVCNVCAEIAKLSKIEPLQQQLDRHILIEREILKMQALDAEITHDEIFTFFVRMMARGNHAPETITNLVNERIVRTGKTALEAMREMEEELYV